jgi:hypothetical protein
VVFLLPMTEYTIWIGGESPWSRTYLGEIGAQELTQEQIDKYFTFDEEGEIDFDHEVLSEKTDAWGEGERDLPTWDTITDGCMGWGAYTDQTVGVCKTDDDENPIFVADVESLSYYSAEEIADNEEEIVERTTAIVEHEEELGCPSGVWILYHSIEKGGYQGTFELPDDVEFDPTKLVLEVREIAETFSIVVGARYNGEDIDMSGDSDGKGIDWYVCHKDQVIQFR